MGKGTLYNRKKFLLIVNDIKNFINHSSDEEFIEFINKRITFDTSLSAKHQSPFKLLSEINIYATITQKIDWEIEFKKIYQMFPLKSTINDALLVYGVDRCHPSISLCLKHSKKINDHMESILNSNGEN